jgi:hypothetical protein
MSKMSRKVGIAAAVFTWSVLLAVPAMAAYKILIGVQTNFTQNDDLSGAFLELDSSGHTSLTFSTGTKAKTKIYINYKARCGVSGASTGSRVAVVIYVDGVAVSPGGTDVADSMCTVGEVFGGAATHFAGNNQQAFTTVGPGTHTVQIRAFLLGDATSWNVGLSTLLVASY